MITRAQQEKQIQGIKVASTAPVISHLFFADDSILFCQATVEACITILGILDDYEAASGQQAKKEKNNVFFQPQYWGRYERETQTTIGSSRYTTA